MATHMAKKQSEIEYSNREIDTKMEVMHEKLDLILVQTTKHNGRLSKLERWMWVLTGAMGAFTWLHEQDVISFFK